VWVGAAPALASLAVAMCSPRDSIPVAASLLGDPSDTASSCLAQRLGRCGRGGRAAGGAGEPPPAGNTRVGTGPCLSGGPEPPARAGKTKKQIFVSYNLQNTDSNFTLLIENRIKEEMTAFPDKF
ncbi:PSMG4 protein, partial [Dicrurus megarhynchus]|nr:PSMG4 protein [Dicrurus megarhynchus]